MEIFFEDQLHDVWRKWMFEAAFQRGTTIEEIQRQLEAGEIGFEVSCKVRGDEDLVVDLK